MGSVLYTKTLGSFLSMSNGSASTSFHTPSFSVSGCGVFAFHDNSHDRFVFISDGLGLVTTLSHNSMSFPILVTVFHDEKRLVYLLIHVESCFE